jgi:hypothetical protein
MVIAPVSEHPLGTLTRTVTLAAHGTDPVD